MDKEPSATQLDQPVPDWLTNSFMPVDQPIEPEPTTNSDEYTTRKRQPSPRTLRRQAQQLTFEIVFSDVMDRVADGFTLTAALREDHRELDVGAFMRWMKLDPERMIAYRDAKELRTEAWASQLVRISEGAGANDPLAMPEDVARSRLRVDTLKWLMAADNRKTYGETKSIEVNQNISITAALEQARGRLIEHAPLDRLTAFDELDDPT